MSGCFTIPVVIKQQPAPDVLHQIAACSLQHCLAEHLHVGILMDGA